ncbi:MAG: glycosyltransferase family 4 protein [Prevotellaceae bacterium]|jgi:glycosyltransferase involved in cell wall biosynthesis|nr:glycosyltransferase family 4 protein [Prevotellaceae bacterium]
MKILIVCSINSGKIAPFIAEQADFLKRAGCRVDFFTVEGKGIKGYLQNRKKLVGKIADFQPDIVHAHYGLSGLLANMQRRIPVVTTYHGSDINNAKILRFSKIAIFLSNFNIFVSEKNILTAKVKKNYALLPCGVDTEIFFPLKNKNEIRRKLNLEAEKQYVLFSSSFDNAVKNYDLAQKSVGKLKNTTLLELKGRTRTEVALLLNAVDCALLTSFTEGSPQFIKEAMACNCPIVSVDAGDVRSNLERVENCYVTDTYNSEEITLCLQKVFAANKRTNGQEKIIELCLDNKLVVNNLIEIYENILNE